MNPERTPELFDQWADDYDRIIQAWSGGFPFRGYERILDRMVQLAAPKPNMRILDVGIGTGTLAKKFSDKGCDIWGIDYSSRMLEKAEEKVPEANLLQMDIRTDWPPELIRPFDRVVSAYVLHHFKLEEKQRIISRMAEDLLEPDGLLIVGDISFQTEKEFDENRKKYSHEWDDSEYYWSADLFIEAMNRNEFTVTYEQISFCGGVYAISYHLNG
ncbi:MAG: class I SAM-dependent methyltransferase [Candidatus Thorarchaeota archaeon]|nr:class I SAM-dependent methyltransferase [Candidatus Thorarchaeota archaeon]MCK5238769.1 class I SAM-dependent methyltransferase [Candidatus Thorarchaeota archaeon]